jgi:hypothetical protein
VREPLFPWVPGLLRTRVAEQPRLTQDESFREARIRVTAAGGSAGAASSPVGRQAAQQRAAEAEPLRARPDVRTECGSQSARSTRAVLPVWLSRALICGG